MTIYAITSNCLEYAILSVCLSVLVLVLVTKKRTPSFSNALLYWMFRD